MADEINYGRRLIMSLKIYKFASPNLFHPPAIYLLILSVFLFTFYTGDFKKRHTVKGDFENNAKTNSSAKMRLVFFLKEKNRLHFATLFFLLLKSTMPKDFFKRQQRFAFARPRQNTAR